MNISKVQNINNIDKIVPLKSIDSYLHSYIRQIPRDSADFKKTFLITREELAKKLEKFGIDLGLINKVVNDCDNNPSLLEKTFENINNAFTKDALKPSEWFEALRYTGASPAFTRENLEALRKIDFSGMKGTAGPVEKLLALNSVKSPDTVEFILTALKPMKKEISPLDLASFSPDMAKFLTETVKGKSLITTEQFIELAKAKGSIKYPYEFFVEAQGSIPYMLPDYNLINHSLFGSQKPAQKEAVEKLYKDTGITVRMDNNLDPENLEYLMEFINITRASGDVVPEKIYITNLLPPKTEGLYGRTNAFFSRPVVNADGTINEKRLSTMAHENGHFLDYKLNKNNGYAQSSKSSASTEMEADLSELFISSYSRKNREEYIAEIKKLAFEGKLLKYKNSQGQIIYRRYLPEKITPELAEEMEPHFAFLLRKYQKFNGPEIRNSVLPIPPKSQTLENAKNYIEVTQRDVNTAMPPDFY